MYSKFFTRLFLLIGMIGMFSASAWAQGGGEIVEIGQATTTTTLSPIYTPKNYSFTQQLYTAEEIGTDGTITSIAFHWAFNGSKTFGIDVYMKHTERTYFETSNDRIPLSASDKVYTGTINPDQDGWITITLDEPFEYDGSSNLVIAVHRTSGSPGFNDLDSNWNVIGTWYYTSTSDYKMLYMGDDQSQYVSLSPAYMTPSYNRPNIQIEIGSSTTTCKAPKNFATSNVTNNSATLTWTAGSEDQSNWDVYLTPSSTGVPDENTTPTYQVTECTKALTGLTAQTQYYAYVRAACSSTDKSRWVSTNFTTTSEAYHIGANNPYETDFESSCDWTFTNGALTNQWCYGNATSNGGQKAIYISNDNGTSNAYTANSAAVVYASKLFTFDQGTYTFVFDWKAYGESTYDYIRAALVPGDAELTASTSLPSGLNTTSLPNGWIALDGGGKLNLQSSWQTQTAEVPVSGTYTMVFVWRNDNGGGTQPPAAIDNISISKLSCSRPTNVVADAATLTWTPGDTGQNTWEISLCTTTNPESGTITIVTGNPTYTFTNLSPETQYYAYVRSDCGSENGKSSWSDIASIYLGYCQPAPTSVDRKGITNVTFGTGDEIVNNSNYPTSSPYYGNYSNLVGAMAASETATVSITYETGYTYGTLIWVDWNSNYEFEDSEIVYRGTSTNANPTTLVASFTVPATQAEGYYRMRIGGADSYFDSFISGNASANHDPCSNGTYKVFHDYTVHVLPVPACPTPTSFVASNVAATSATLSWTENGTATNWVLQYGTDANFATYTEKTSGFSTNGNNISIGITELNGETHYYARVKSVNGSDESEWATCDFTTLPTCPAPTGLSASKTGTTITLNWTAGVAGQDAWDIRYKKTTDSEYTFVHLENQATTSYTITDLSPVTTYSVNVRAWCDENDQSKWGYNANNQNLDLSVTTDCGAIELPYTCNFEGTMQTVNSCKIPSCWSVIKGYQNSTYSYGIPTVANQSSSTQPIAYPHGGNYCLYFLNSTYSGTSEEYAILPEISENYGMRDIQISFWVRSNNTDCQMEVGVMTDPSNANTYVKVADVEISSTYTEKIIGLNSYTGKGRYIALKCPAASMYSQAFYVDDITVEYIPSCLVPDNLSADIVDVNEVTLTWTPRGNETAWNVQYKKVSDSEWSEPIAVDETTYTLTGLLRSTEYEVRVQANCDDDDQSDWTNPISFETECGIWPIDETHALIESFNGETFPPDCWQKVNFGEMGITNGWLQTVNNPMDNQGAVSSDFKYETWLFLPQMHLDGEAFLSFNHLFGNGDDYITSSIMISTTPDLTVQDILTEGFIEANFAELWTADETDLPSASRKEVVSLNDYDGDDVYIAFRYEGTYNYSGRIWYIDNVKVYVNTNQSVELTQGTNWFSSYLDIELEDLQNALNAALTNATSMTIKSKNSNCRWNGNTHTWRATNGFVWDVAKMYMIEVPENCEIILTGEPINPAEHSITIEAGTATWIGFPFSESMTFDQAILDGFAVNGDQIKYKNGNARYNNVQWRTTGNFNTLEPGKGYMYNSAASVERTLIFPINAK